MAAAPSMHTTLTSVNANDETQRAGRGAPVEDFRGGDSDERYGGQRETRGPEREGTIEEARSLWQLVDRPSGHGPLEVHRSNKWLAGKVEPPHT